MKWSSAFPSPPIQCPSLFSLPLSSHNHKYNYESNCTRRAGDFARFWFENKRLRARKEEERNQAESSWDVPPFRIGSLWVITHALRAFLMFLMTVWQILAVFWATFSFDIYSVYSKWCSVSPLFFFSVHQSLPLSPFSLSVTRPNATDGHYSISITRECVKMRECSLITSLLFLLLLLNRLESILKGKKKGEDLEMAERLTHSHDSIVKSEGVSSSISNPFHFMVSSENILF